MCFPHNELSDLESISYITLIQAKSFTTHAANKRFLDRCSRTIKKHILGNIMTKGEGGGGLLSTPFLIIHSWTILNWKLICNICRLVKKACILLSCRAEPSLLSLYKKFPIPCTHKPFSSPSVSNTNTFIF